MSKYNLTSQQKDLLKWIAQANENPDSKIMLLLGDDGYGLSCGGESVEVDKLDLDHLRQQELIQIGQLFIKIQQWGIDAVKSNFGEDEQISTIAVPKIDAVFGEPSSDNEFKCDVFMIMPFAEEFGSIYRDYVKPTVEDLGLTIKRGDDFFSHHEIINEIWSAINASQIVIADCTGRNPNVFYELGIAHTLGKIAVLITQNNIDVPFDVRGKRFIVYQDNSAGLKILCDKLKEYVSKAAKK